MADEPINEAQMESLIPPDMTTVYLVLIKRGPIWTAESTEATKRLQEQHLAYIRRMHREGKMIMAGPLADGGSLEG